jgi:hypothetical protein
VRAVAFPRLRQELCVLDRLRLMGLGHAGTLTNQAAERAIGAVEVAARYSVT